MGKCDDAKWQRFWEDFSQKTRKSSFQGFGSPVMEKNGAFVGESSVFVTILGRGDLESHPTWPWYRTMVRKSRKMEGFLQNWGLLKYPKMLLPSNHPCDFRINTIQGAWGILWGTPPRIIRVRADFDPSLAAARINARSRSSDGATCRSASPRAQTAAIASSSQKQQPLIFHGNWKLKISMTFNDIQWQSSYFRKKYEEIGSYECQLKLSAKSYEL